MMASISGIISLCCRHSSADQNVNKHGHDACDITYLHSLMMTWT